MGAQGHVCVISVSGSTVLRALALDPSDPSNAPEMLASSFSLPIDDMDADDWWEASIVL
jgi:hypothetical protein